VGYVVGAGAEYRVNANWSLKGEFLHYDFGDAAPAGNGIYTLRPTLNSGKIGITYRF
jgi:outer membrane immunogenic protein